MADVEHQRFIKSVFYTPPLLQNHQRIYIINCFDADYS